MYFGYKYRRFYKKIITYPVRIRVKNLDRIDKFTNHLIDLFGKALDRFQGPGDLSGTILVLINALILYIAEYLPQQISSYLEISNYLKKLKNT